MTHLLFNLTIFWFLVAFVQAQKLTIESFTPSPVYVKVGNILTLDVTYKYTGTGSYVGVTWKKGTTLLIRKYANNGDIKKFDNRTSFKGDVGLVLKNVSSKDNEIFEVELSGDDTSDEPKKTFTVIVPVAEITNCSQKIEQEEGKNIACQCSCKNGKSPAEAVWYKDDKMVIKSGSVNTTLLIKNIQIEHDGTYKCVCQGGTSKDEKKMTIQVKYAPKVVSISNRKKDKIAYLTDETLTITCKADGYPEPTYKIFHNGTLVGNGVVYMKQKVTYSDAGYYTCEASNIIGQTNGSFFLNVSDKSNSENTSSSTQLYVTGIACFIGGTVFGMILLYGIFLAHRQLTIEKKKSSTEQHSSYEYENAGAERNTTYQELDISKMNEESNYQSLKMNPRSMRHDETPNKNDVGYAELNQTRGIRDENCQSLNPV